MSGIPDMCGRVTYVLFPFWCALMATPPSDVARIRQLNDDMRTGGPITRDDARWLVTRGVINLGRQVAQDALRAVSTFDKFDADNDPHGEHDFGSFTIAGETLFWKIDYHDRQLQGASPDATDIERTCRVLTLMLASEY